MHYTRKGDGGKTRIRNCSREVTKDSPTTMVLGDIDELNSVMGLCRAKMRSGGYDDTHDMVREVQEVLFTAQAQIAGADKRVKRGHLERLEFLIEQIEREVRLPQSFIVPGASELSALCDVARTVARRAERSFVKLCIVQKPGFCEGDLPAYLNRLSSFLYVLARSAAYREGKKEEAPQYDA